MLLALLFTLTYAESICSSGGRTWIPSCPTGNTAYNCEKYYTWNVNYETADYYDQPSKCVWNYATSKCQKDTNICTPNCRLNPSYGIVSAYRKQGGPNGWVCSTFTTQTTCANNYVDDYGDRWCFWKNGQCNTGRLCYV